MALLTIAEHITEAMEQAGNTGLQTRLQNMYPVILRSLYAACPWPFVKRTSDAVISVAAGATNFSIANSVFYNGLTTIPRDGILSINRVIARDAALTSSAWDLDVVHADEADPESQPLLMPTTRRGRPTECVVQPVAKTVGTNGVQWVGSFNPIPDLALSLVVVANCVPSEDLANTAIRPVFESDEIIIHALYTYCLRHQQDERALAELQELKNVLGQHRAQLKGTSGKAQKMQLSRAKFGGSRNRQIVNAWFTPWW